MKQLDIACIIDDDELFTYVLSKQMQVVNFSKTVLVFHNGLEALNYLRPIVESPEALPAVILLDLNMPVLDGWQFLDEFMRLRPVRTVTVFIVSSSIDAADHERALAYKDVKNFYIKPITEENLIEILNEALAAVMRPPND
ncbi:MAG: response regulator [Bacteroidetes bacterium]|nr:response regulator [Bacteroidota bacterium]